MDLIALAAAKNYTNKVAAGFKNIELDGMNLIFTLLDDTKATIAIPAPADGKDGVSVKDLSIDTDGSLLCHMTDGTVIDAGYVPTVDPDLTSYYTKEETDNQNVNSLDFYTVKGVNSLPSSGGANTLGSATSTIIANIRESAKRKRLAAFYDTTNYILWYPQYTLDSLAKSATGLKLNYVGSGAGIAGLSGNSGSTQRSMGSTYLYVYVNIDEEGNITKSPDSYSPNIGMNSSQSYLSIWNTKAFTPTGDYHPATKKYVDTNVDTKLEPFYWDGAASSTSDQTNVTLFQSVIDAMKKGKKVCVITNNTNSERTKKLENVILFPATDIDVSTYTGELYFSAPGHYYHKINTNGWNEVNLMMRRCATYIRMADGVVTYVNAVDVYDDQVTADVGILTKNNKKEFTPTTDYNPATKKYVDDSIADINIPEIDLTNYYTKEEMKTTYLGLPIFKIPTEFLEIQSWITENVIPYATENGWDSFYLEFDGLSSDTDQNYFKGLYFLEAFYDINEEESRNWKTYYFKSINGYTPTTVDTTDHTDFATMYPAIALYLNADNSVKNFETTSVSDISTNSATALRTDIDYETPYMPLYNGSPATKLYVDNKVAAIRTPKSHDGEGMIGWYGTAVAGDNLTELYGVTPDMVRAVKAGDYISWPSRVQTGATENTICLYNMTYEVYDKDEMENLETIDIKIGKSPDTTYTYVIVGDNVYKETF